MIGRLLAHRLAHAHPHRALHLSFHRETVERLAAVMRDPDVAHLHEAGLGIVQVQHDRVVVRRIEAEDEVERLARRLTEAIAALD